MRYLCGVSQHRRDAEVRGATVSDGHSDVSEKTARATARTTFLSSRPPPRGLASNPMRACEANRKFIFDLILLRRVRATVNASPPPPPRGQNNASYTAVVGPLRLCLPARNPRQACARGTPEGGIEAPREAATSERQQTLTGSWVPSKPTRSSLSRASVALLGLREGGGGIIGGADVVVVASGRPEDGYCATRSVGVVRARAGFVSTKKRLMTHRISVGSGPGGVFPDSFLEEEFIATGGW